MNNNLTMDGNEIYIVVEGPHCSFKKLIIPGLEPVQVSKYKFITSDGDGHIVVQFKRKKSKLEK
jgi:hypothetical protein